MHAKRGLTGINPLRITIGLDGMIQWPFYCHHLKAEWLRSIISFYRLRNMSKTPKLCLFENLHTMVAAAILFFFREQTLTWAVSRHKIFNFICSKVCTLMSWHDIDIIIMKYWLVLSRYMLNNVNFTGGEICCSTL